MVAIKVNVYTHIRFTHSTKELRVWNTRFHYPHRFIGLIAHWVRAITSYSKIKKLDHSHLYTISYARTSENKAKWHQVKCDCTKYILRVSSILYKMLESYFSSSSEKTQPHMLYAQRCWDSQHYSFMFAQLYGNNVWRIEYRFEQRTSSDGLLKPSWEGAVIKISCFTILFPFSVRKYANPQTHDQQVFDL